MNILMVLAGEIDLKISDFLTNNKVDYIVAIDGGYNHLYKEDIKPDILIGDFDSAAGVDKVKNIKLSKTKDYTDYEHALKYIEENFKYNKITVLGFLSLKRPEHFYANLKNLNKGMEYVSSKTCIKLLEPGEHVIEKIKYVSFFAKTKVEKLNLEGFEYELKDYNLDVNDTLCISNEVKDKGKVYFKKGQLIVFLSKS